jgi:hypothetical protein
MIVEDHLHDIRRYLNLYESSEPVIYSDIQVESKIDESMIEIINDLERLRVKLENHRELEDNADYNNGYESACLKVVEMLDRILIKYKQDNVLDQA